jgi:hypothetical protein
VGAVAAMVFTLPRFRTKHEQDAAELYDSSPTRVAACSAQLPGQRSADGHARGSLYDTLGVRHSVRRLPGARPVSRRAEGVNAARRARCTTRAFRHCRGHRARKAWGCRCVVR